MAIIRRTLALKSEDWDRLEALAISNRHSGWHSYVRSLAQGQPAVAPKAHTEPIVQHVSVTQECNTPKLAPRKGPTKFGASEIPHWTPTTD
jgi:hypothetical protein